MFDRHPESKPDSLLTVAMKHRAGSLSMDLEFQLSSPWTVLFGPSGSGKTTVLRAIAGFVRPDTGRITHGPMERVLVSTGERIFVPAHRRPVRSAGQTARLFSRLNVEENVRYGIGGRSHAGSEPQSRDEQGMLVDVMALMRLTTLAGRRTGLLSGGERQRVSVARAVAAAVTYDGPEKALLLLDEPFAGLDGVLRDDLAVALRDWLARWKVPVLSVSHDVGECHLLGAEVIRMAEGQVIEQGPVETVLAREREQLLARLG